MAIDHALVARGVGAAHPVKPRVLMRMYARSRVGDTRTRIGFAIFAGMEGLLIGLAQEWSGKSETVESEDRDVVGLAETLRLFGDATR